MPGYHGVQSGCGTGLVTKVSSQAVGQAWLPRCPVRLWDRPGYQGVQSGCGTGLVTKVSSQAVEQSWLPKCPVRLWDSPGYQGVLTSVGPGFNLSPSTDQGTRNSIGSDKMRMIVRKLCSRDPHQFFQRLETLARYTVILS